MTQTATPAKKLTASEKRFAFIKDITSAAGERDIARATLKNAGLDPEMVPAMTVEELEQVALDMASKGLPLGRTSRWEAACTFARNEIDAAREDGKLDASFAHWAVFQGSVWMGYAA